MTSIEILLKQLASPARRAILSAGISTLEDLADYDEKTFSGLHGIGPNALATCKIVLEAHGLAFKEEARDH